MRKRLTLVVGLVVLVATTARLAYAVGQTITYQIFTAAQDIGIQFVVIPEANTALCAKYSLPTGCTAPQLVTNGCVAVSASLITNIATAYQNCTPFTADAAGENAWAADLAAQHLATAMANDLVIKIKAGCLAWKAQTTAQKNTAAAAMTPPQPAGTELCQ